MKIKIQQPFYLGTTELPEIRDGEPIPLAKVRIRQSKLTSMLDEFSDRIHRANMQSDYQEAKELREEQKVAKDQIAVLKAIRTQADRQTYAEYVSKYSS